MKVSRFALNNLEEYAIERSPNYVTRTVLGCLSGFPPEKKFHTPNKVSRDEMLMLDDTGISKAPEGWRAILEEFYNMFISLPQFCGKFFIIFFSVL